MLWKEIIDLLADTSVLCIYCYTIFTILIIFLLFWSFLNVELHSVNFLQHFLVIQHINEVFMIVFPLLAVFYLVWIQQLDVLVIID